MELLKYLIEVLPAIIVILNPFGGALIFVSLTMGDNRAELMKQSRRTALTVIITLFVFMFLGQYIFQFFHITLSAFRIAGGILLFGMGMSMIRGQHHQSKITEKERAEVVSREDISIIPMGIPVLSGPGSIATIMVYRTNAEQGFEIAALTFSVVLAGILVYFVLKYSHYLVNKFGKTALRIISRIMGLMVVTMAVQFIISGVTTVLANSFPGLLS
ncbi:MAG: MarC family protein [Candidatus Marinimicrobia bacterium]|nr:MarC family protein [Candidatus Neomarinimicrobiota bacterium]MCF7922635.1 MarC family protein [Candidatus Neomarinimicrobiota bacterium]